MPKLTEFDGRYDFGLSNLAFNKRVAKRLLDENGEVIAESNHYLLAFSQKSQVVYLYSTGQARLDFYCSIFEIHSKKLGLVARQDAIWKRRGTLLPDVARINFRWLLHRHDTVMSSSLQTADGQRFWKVRLREAVQLDLAIGMWDSTEGRYYEPTGDLDDWLDQVKPWGDDASSETRLLFVSRRKSASA